MKTLDEQVPSGYFETLPNQTLARLEGSMQHGSGTTENRKPGAAATPAAPAAQPPAAEREEDSGLHDIRNLAASTRSRMSSKRIGSVPPPMEDDALSSSSGSSKNIALPQPAKMVSLPELAEHEVSARPAKPSKKEARSSEAAIADAPIAAPSTSSRFSLPSQERRRSKGPLIAILGLGVAAAAGAVIYMQVFQNADEAQTVASANQAKAPAVAVATTPAPVAAPAVQPPPPATEAKADEGVAGGGAAAPAAATGTADQQIAAPEPAPADETAKDEKASKGSSKKTAKPAKGKRAAVEKAEPAKTEVKPAETKPEPKKPVDAKTKAADGEDFDALLKEAGVQEKKADKPKLEKKTLSSDDFRKVMGGLEGKAKACYKGTQGNAVVKLTVAPSGQVSKLTVGGEFGGKPEAACIEKAFKSATFPPWDGAPMTYTYAVLLSD